MGREPTSTACHTCRTRHIACDRTKPTCNRCQQSGYECKGYKKVLRTQNHGIVAGDEPGSSRFGTIGRTNSYPDFSVKVPGSNDAVTAVSAPSDAISSRLVPDFLPFVDHITLSYLFDAYSWINVHSILLQDTPMRQRLTQQSDELGYDSLRALAHGIFSRDHHIGSLRQSAARLYGASLQKLQSKLTATPKSDLAPLIKPIAIMGSYSIAVEKDLRFTHHHGLARILDYCGPECFQDSAILPMFESCRLTLIASATVRRQRSFLEQEQWRTVPWSLSPASKTNTSKLLDIMARVPGIIQGTDDVLNERAQWTANRGGGMIRQETPSTIPDLQQCLTEVFMDLTRWRTEWELDNSPAAHDVLDWALLRAGDDYNRPGIYGVQGPDVFGLNMTSMADLDIPFASGTLTTREPQPNDATFTLLQDAALYVTVLIWADRLRKNLTRAARAPDSVDFYNAPFYTQCHCYFDSPGPSRHCQIFPESHNGMDISLSWNINSPRFSESPIRFVTSGHSESGITTTACGSGIAHAHQSEHRNHCSPSDEMAELATRQAELLLPGDVRFSGQLRILSWLIRYLPDSRAYVLGTLAAMGLSHCVHDVRPLEGNESIAETIRGTMARSGFEEAADLLLRNYR